MGTRVVISGMAMGFVMITYVTHFMKPVFAALMYSITLADFSETSAIPGLGVGSV